MSDLPGSENATPTLKRGDHDVAAKFDGFNPYDVPCSLLKDETPPHTSTASFFGLSSKRYCLFERKKSGAINILKASEHGLGAFQVPAKREEWTRRVWERMIRSAEDDARGATEDVGAGFYDIPATGEFALTKPSLWPRVSHIEGMRPFNFLTLLYRDSSIYSGNGMASGPEYLPFVSPKDTRWFDLITTLTLGRGETSCETSSGTGTESTR